MKHVTIYTDGSSKGNPGPSGYGTLLVYQGVEKTLSQGFIRSTNSRMELLGAIAGLEALLEPCSVVLISDSKYLVDAVNKKRLAKWLTHGWKTTTRAAVKNQDLWKRLNILLTKHQVVFKWVAGHSNHTGNECCDRLAKAASGAKKGHVKDVGYAPKY